MLHQQGCQEFETQFACHRRRALTIGGAAALGMSLPNLLQLRANENSGTFGSAKSVIFVFLHGGNPQHETWDPRPDAPAEIRGEFGSIETSLPGVRFSELFPQCAKVADRMAVVRSMAHGNTNHVQACLPAMTGHKHPPSVRTRGDFPPSPSDFPHFGAVLDHVRSTNVQLPSWVQIGPQMTRSNRTVLHGQSPGFLGQNYSPLKIDQDLQKPDVKIEAISPQVGVGRLKSRKELLAEFENSRRQLDQNAASVKDEFYQRAVNLLTSDKTRAAFDLSAESAKSRQRYPQNQVGQSCLLARRLVEAGVPFVNVHYCKTPSGSWDTHSKNFVKMKDSLGPTLDGSLSVLIEELEERGMLDEVLVVAMAEFGRTPTVNKNAGRDHWPFVYSLALAGAGLKRGVVHGASDIKGAYPQSNPHDPADMAATIYHLLGVPADTVLYDQQRRPHQLVIGNPIDAILA